MAIVGSTLSAAEVLHLRLDQTAPSEAVGTWLRLSDGATLSVQTGEALRDFAPGVYRSGTRRLALRSGDTAADWAASLVGLRSANLGSENEREQGVEQLIAVDPFALVIFAWRRADTVPWPWVGHGLTTGGLLGLTTLQITHEDHVQFDGVTGAYVVGGQPITIGSDRQVALGDIIVARPAHAILVADRGVRGLLDPADEIVVSLPAADPQVQRMPLGELAGRGAFAVWRRDPGRLGSDPASGRPAHHLSDKMEQLSELPPHRQWMAAAGMVLICAALLRLLWKRRAASGDPKT